MDKQSETFEQFLVNQKAEILLQEFVINLVIVAVLAWALKALYIRFGHSLSNRRSFAGNFILVAVTTMVIITIVKSSLALSLGLVGALSIVRFRTAIKEPEELAFIFINIAIGLGLGAGQREVTVIGFVFLAIIIWLRQLGKKDDEWQNLFLTLNAPDGDKLCLDAVSELLRSHCQQIDLRRFDEADGQFEVSFQVELTSFDDLVKIKRSLKEVYQDVEISFLDNHIGLT